MSKKDQSDFSKAREHSSGIALVTDSASDIDKATASGFDISIIPIYIHHNGREFKDGIDIDADTIYRLQIEEKAVFSTSAPSPHDFLSIYRDLLEKYSKIISIHISSRLSAVIKSARIARETLKADDRIEIIDSLSGSMGTGFMVLAAARAMRKGYGFKKIMDMLSFLKDNIRLYGTIDTLKYLQRGGRVHAIASLATRFLIIKPLLAINDGLVDIMGIAFTRTGSIREIVKRTVRDYRDENWVMAAVIHTLGEDESKKIMPALKRSLNVVYSLVSKCTPTVGVHTGPGLIGIIITRLDREIADLFNCDITKPVFPQTQQQRI